MMELQQEGITEIVKYVTTDNIVPTIVFLVFLGVYKFLMTVKDTLTKDKDIIISTLKDIQQTLEKIKNNIENDN